MWSQFHISFLSILCIFIAITSVYVCRFITTISYHSVTLIFILYLRLLLSFPHTAWLYMIITLFLYPDERSTEHLSLRKFFPLSRFLFFIISSSFIEFLSFTYIKLYINIHEHIFLSAFSFSLGVLCFAYYVLFFCFTWQKFFIVWKLYGLFYFVLNSVHEGETLYTLVLYRKEYSRSIESFTHQKLRSLGIINWLQFTEI